MSGVLAMERLHTNTIVLSRQIFMSVHQMRRLLVHFPRALIEPSNRKRQMPGYLGVSGRLSEIAIAFALRTANGA